MRTPRIHMLYFRLPPDWYPQNPNLSSGPIYCFARRSHAVGSQPLTSVTLENRSGTRCPSIKLLLTTRRRHQILRALLKGTKASPPCSRQVPISPNGIECIYGLQSGDHYSFAVPLSAWISWSLAYLAQHPHPELPHPHESACPSQKPIERPRIG